MTRANALKKRQRHHTKELCRLAERFNFMDKKSPNWKKIAKDRDFSDFIQNLASNAPQITRSVLENALKLIEDNARKPVTATTVKKRRIEAEREDDDGEYLPSKRMKSSQGVITSISSGELIGRGASVSVRSQHSGKRNTFAN